MDVDVNWTESLDTDMDCTDPPVILNRSDWVVIDRIKFSLDGRVCDRIETMDSAFCNQISRCTSPFNSCLRFQLQDYIEEDSSRLLKGLRPRFALTQYGEFGYANEGSYSRFLLPLQEITKSVIMLELNADNVKFLVNRSPGKILSITTPKFEALSRDGAAKIVVSNTGELLAGFFLARKSIQLEDGVDPNLQQSSFSLQSHPEEPPETTSDEELLDWLEATHSIPCFTVSIGALSTTTPSTSVAHEAASTQAP
ncbi:hypothetical protein L7F22_030976 [Adiantum nelumboides]|nr:hypothetical protein [Adiantum nelumboides]